MNLFFQAVASCAALICVVAPPAVGHVQSKPGFSCEDGATYPVALTFDDGPHPKYTAAVLDVLKDRNVKAAFFVMGEKFAPGRKDLDKNFELLERMRQEGHHVGSHTYSHLNHTLLSRKAARENIRKGTEYNGDYLDPIMRLPYGAGYFRSNDPKRQKKNDEIMELVKESGYEHVAWDVDTNDWDKKKRPYLLRSMMRLICAEKGGIILLHDIQRNTAVRVGEWIDAIEAAGHRIVGLEEFVEGLNP